MNQKEFGNLLIENKDEMEAKFTLILKEYSVLSSEERIAEELVMSLKVWIKDKIDGITIEETI